MSASESEISFEELNLAANDDQTDVEYSFVLSETDSDIGEKQIDGKVQRSSTPINTDNILPVKNALITFDFVFPERKLDHIDVMKMATLVERMDSMLTNEIGSDVKFVFIGADGESSDEEEVKAHKCILMSGTNHFSEGTNFEGENQDQIRVPTTLGFGRDAVLTMLKWIYTDVLPTDKSKAAEGFSAANYYGIPVLEEYCFDVLKSSTEMETKDFSTILNVASRSPEKQEKALEFIDLNAEDVLSSAAFLTIGTELLKTILRRNLKADERSIYRSVSKWAEKRCYQRGVDNPTGKELRAELEKEGLLYLIRFPLIDTEYLANEIHESGILNNEELANLYRWKHTKNDAIVSPFLTQARRQED